MSINLNLIDMENLKEVLMSFRDFASFGEDVHFTDELIDNFIIHYKPCPREPEAINRNEQAKEFCEVQAIKNQCAKKRGFICNHCNLINEQNG
jgi:hypothetical protein